MKYIFIFALLFVFASCSKDNKPTTTTDKQQTEQKQQQTELNDDTNPADTNLTPEEKFSSSVMDDFLDNAEDDDLQGFLEDEVYTKYAGNFTGAAVIGLTPSTWLLALEKDNTTKNFLIQRFVDFKSNEYYYRMNETSIKIQDVVSAGAK